MPWALRSVRGQIGRALFCLLFAVLFAAPVQLALVSPADARQKAFTNAEAASEAADYKLRLKATSPGLKAADIARWRKLGEDLLNKGEARRAVNALSGVASISAPDARLWLDLAQALLAIKPNDNETYALLRDATAAAYLSYQVADNDNEEAAALATLGGAYARRSYWRPAIDSLKISNDLVANPQVQQTYARLRTEYGFRLLDYTVDSDTATPRVCIQFSEALIKAQQDYAKFLKVNGADASAVALDDQQLCVEGLKHGERYAINVRAGLPSAIGEAIEKTSDLAVYVRDRSPFVRFSGRAYVLPNKGQQGIPIVSVNTDVVKIKLFRIGDRGLSRAVIDGRMQNQFSESEIDDMRRSDGEQVWAGEMPTKRSLNQEITTAFPVSEAVPTLQPGVYAMVAEAAGAKSEYWDPRATQWFIVSDLGLTALTSTDGLHTFVRSLESAEPTAGTTVRLIARNNEVLGTATTDANGYARFPAGLARGEGGMQPAILAAETAAGDYAFLDLSSGAFDLSDRGVSGRTAPGPLDGFVFTERGVYRPGEEVHLTALLRDANAVASSDVPLTMIITRPDGVEYRRIVLVDQGLGGRTTTMALATTSMTGTWRVRAHADPKADPIGQASFLVEDYVPERMDMTLAAKTPTLQPGQRGEIDIAGRYLYGPPAADLAIEGDVIVRTRSSGFDGYKGYRFGISNEPVLPARGELAGLPRTDAEGNAVVPVALPSLPRTSQLLEAQVLLRLREPSGRTIERDVTLPIAPEGPVIGIKPAFDGGSIDNGAQAEFDIVLLDPAGKPLASKGLTWELFKVSRSYQWYSRYGNWRWEAVTYTNLAGNGTLGEGEGPARIGSRVEWGSYRLDISSADPNGPSASYTFRAGWGGSESEDTPETLDVALDKDSYAPGDVAKLAITPQGAGKALIAVLGQGLSETRLVDIAEGGTTVELPVTSEWAPGAYVTAMFYRPMDIAQKRMPSRSIGLQWLQVDRAARTLGLTMVLPEKIGSGETLNIPIKLDGLTAGEPARLVVAAVDVGILNLTGYQAPAPEDWYYAQRQLGTEIRDLYGRLIDGMRAERGSLRSGGDDVGGDQRGGRPPSQAPLALFSGLVDVGPDGTADVGFELPAFNGSVKVMAVAWSKDKVGHAEQEVIVRDAVPMLISAPRFLILGDKARVLVDLHNVEGPAGDYRLTVGSTADGLLPRQILDRTVQLASGQRVSEALELTASDVGMTHLAVRLTGPADADIDISREVALDVQAPATGIRRATTQSVAAGGSVSVTKDLIADLIATRAEVTISVGAAAGFDVPGLLTALDRYPYGCAEQTTSRALPLLYLNMVAARAGMKGEAESKERIEKAVLRLLEMQNSSGAFGLWSPGGGDQWLSAYVTDFLTRAREQGYAVPKLAFDQALDRLQNTVSTTTDFENGGEEVAYALYVLARNGRAPVGDLRYYVDTRLDRFSTPLAQAQLGAALAMYGDTARAETAFRTAIGRIVGTAIDGSDRRDFGTSLRDGAGALALMSETGIAKGSVAQLTRYVVAARETRSYTSTQENAWMLLAARGLLDDTKSTLLSVDGSPHQGTLNRVLTASDLDGQGLKVTNMGDAPINAVISVSGSSMTPEPESASGFTIARSYFKLDGTEVDLKAVGRLAQNERLVVVLKASAIDGLGGRVLLVDRLPAGLEIENPRIVEAGDVESLSWLQVPVHPEHTEFRDDRFVAAFDLGQSSAREMTVAYMVRATNQGEFLHPAATVEDMYRPDRFARTASNRLVVGAAN